MAYRLVIGCNIKQYETLGGVFNPDRYLVLDKIDDRTVQSSATLATQPMQSGDTMADHMYRNPTTYSVSGTFSLNGKNRDDDSYNFVNSGDRLTNIQTAFEEIKDKGILCTLVTLDCDEDNGNLKNLDAQGNVVDASTRFKIRRNMALESITWTEMYNSMKFSFNFKQVLLVETQVYENLSEAERLDLGLPNVSNPSGSSLGTVLADNGALAQSVIDALHANGYIDDDFLAALAEIAQDLLTIIIARAVILVAASVLIGTIYATSALLAAGATLGSSALIFPVGTVVAAAVVIVAAIVVGIQNIFNRRERERKRRITFKLINGSAEPDGIRLQNLLDDIEVQVNKANSNITIYNISENKEQQVILNIAGNYYTIEFKQNNTDMDPKSMIKGYGWFAQVKDLSGNPITTMQKDKWCVVSSLLDLNRNQNCWFKDSTKQYEVYLFNPAFSSSYNSDGVSVEAVKKDLRSYTIFVSKGNIQENVENINNAINNAIENEGFV